MQENRAFEVLGVPSTATEREILDRYRELAKEAHPDAGGDDEAMKELNAAKEVALLSIRNRALVPVSAVLEILRAAAPGGLVETRSKAEERKERREVTKQAVSSIARYHANPRREYMRRSTVFAGLSGTLGVLTSKALGLLDQLPVLADSGAKEIISSPEMTSAFMGLSLICGVYAWVYSARAKEIEQTLEDVSDELTDKAIYLDVLFRLLEAHHYRYRVSGEEEELPVGGFTTEDLLRQTREFYYDRSRSSDLRQLLYRVRGFFAPLFFSPPHGLRVWKLLRLIGPSDFTRLLITKGKELEVLEESQKLHKGRPYVVYTIAEATADD